VHYVSTSELEKVVKERDELSEELKELCALKEGIGKSAHGAQDFAKGPE